MSNSNIVLGDNQFGKAEVRLVKVTRDTVRHEIEDLSVTSQVRGELASAYYDGTNETVVATDTQKNTVFSFARDGVNSPEEFLLRLADHFTSNFSWITGGRWEAEQYGWNRIPVGNEGENHSFVRDGQEARTAVVVRDGDTTHVVAGLKDLTVLKTTASGFVGYPKDKYTTLPETEDRILATDVKARWRYNTSNVDFNAVYESVKKLFLEGFGEKYSYALQQTAYEMGTKALEAHPEIDEIKFSMPNNHHFVVDLSPFDQDNPNVVFHAADRPYGLIEATIKRDDATDAGNAWDGMAGFC